MTDKLRDALRAIVASDAAGELGIEQSLLAQVNEALAAPAQPLDGWGGIPPTQPTALQRYNELCADDDATDPLERLRFFCSLAMNGQDWIDVERFFDAAIDAAMLAAGEAPKG